MAKRVVNNRDNFSAAMAAAKENAEKITKCHLHNFTVVNDVLFNLPKEYVCSNCGGIIRPNEYLMYEQGLQHGRANHRE